MSVAAEKLNKQMIVALADRWPKCFAVSAQRRRSLKQRIESRHGWLDSEIDDWITARMAERDGLPATLSKQRSLKTQRRVSDQRDHA
jgi:hypothetical protein